MLLALVFANLGRAYDRIALLRPIQVDARVTALTANPAARFLHCLPAFHNADTTVGREIRERYGLEALEVTDEVFESPAFVVFDEAENQRANVRAACEALAPIAHGHELVITHGNGPQVGLLALQSAAYSPVEPYPWTSSMRRRRVCSGT